MLGGRAAWTVTRVTRALAEPSEAFELTPLPGLNDDPFTLATAWTWVLAGSDPENEARAIELAEWLIQDEFLNEWVNAAGYLPTRSSDLNARFPALSATAETAQPVPSNDLLAALTPVLQQAAARILAGDPVEAVTQDAVQALR
jgi:ABC-type glycerol-3-phosphate transport system substrate-binding protein